MKINSICNYPNLKAKKHSAGSYGYYIPFGKNLGVKILKTSIDLSSTKDELEECDEAIEIATKEATALEMCGKTGFAPKYHGFIVFKKSVNIKGTIKIKYYPGIVMEHIDGKDLNYKYLNNIGYDFIYYLEKRLKSILCKCGIDVQDWHQGNIMVKKNCNIGLLNPNFIKNFVRIDFGICFPAKGFRNTYNTIQKKHTKNIIKILGNLVKSN